MPGSQKGAVPAGNNVVACGVLDGSDLQNADVMEFDEGSGPADPKSDKCKQQFLHADFYNDFGDLFDYVKV